MAVYEFAGAYDAAVLDTNSQLLKLVAFELVTEPGAVAATLYTDRLRTATVAQPFLSDAEGNVHLFTDPGRYRLRQVGVPPGEQITVQPDPDETEGELEAHVIAADPHPVYLTAAEGNAAFAPIGEPASGAHVADPIDAHDASAVSFVPGGSVAATDVQAAVDEVALDYIAADASHVAAGDPHPVYTTSAEAAAAAPVQSVFGRTGNVTALQADYDTFFLTPAEGDALFLTPAEGNAAYEPLLPSFTPGSVLFADGAGDVNEDPANLFWDDANNRCHIGPRAAYGATLGALNVYGPSPGLGGGDLFLTQIPEPATVGPPPAFVTTRVGLGAGSIFSNFAAGSGALGSISGTNASGNTAVGYNSLGALTTGTKNVAVGTVAGGLGTTTQDMVAVGYHALLVATGNGNTAVGSLAGKDLSSGIANVMLGANAMLVATSADRNTALGEQTLGSLTTGDNNTAVGSTAGYGITTGTKNIFVGWNAGSAAPAALTGAVIIGGHDGTGVLDGEVLFTDGLGTERWRMTSTSRFTLPAAGTYYVGANQVVGPRGAAVADAAGGAVIDIEARAALNALLARVRAATGHGLIA